MLPIIVLVLCFASRPEEESCSVGASEAVLGKAVVAADDTKGTKVHQSGFNPFTASSVDHDIVFACGSSLKPVHNAGEG